MVTPSKSKKAEVITLPTDAACLNFFRGGEPKCFCCLLWIFDSGLKWWTQVTNLQWKFFGLAWKWVRSVLEMSTLFSSCSDVSIFGTQFADSLLISKISVKTVWTKPELMSIDLAICQPVRRLSSKIIQWMASICSSVIEGFWMVWPMVIFCAVYALFESCSPCLHSCKGRGVLCEYLYSIGQDWIPNVRSQLQRKGSSLRVSVLYPHWFPCEQVLYNSAWGSVLSISRFLTHISNLYELNLNRN